MGIALILPRSRKGWLIPVVALGLATITPLFEFALALYRGFQSSQWPLLGLAIAVIPILLILIALRCLLNEAFCTTAIRVPTPAAGGVSPQGNTLDAQETTTVKPRRVKALFWSIIGTGAVLPWAIGLAVREHLLHQGKPVLPLHYFIGGSPIEFLFFLAMTAYLASPFLILAFLARVWLVAGPTTSTDTLSYRRRLAGIVGGFLGTCIGTVILYIWVWWEFDPLFLLLPLPLLPLVGTAGGLPLGLFLSGTFQTASHDHRID